MNCSSSHYLYTGNILPFRAKNLVKIEDGQKACVSPPYFDQMY